MPENTAAPRYLSLIAIGVLVIALAVVFLGGLKVNDDDPATVDTRASTTETYGIVTAGEGKVSAKPDQLTFSASITNTRSTTAAAMAATNHDVRAVTIATKNQGVAAEDIETTDISIRPKYDYNSSGQHLVGYTSSQRVRVLVRKLNDAGKVIGGATTAAGNAVSVSGIQLSISNKDDLIAQARTDAVTRSKEAAEALAKAAGRDVGDLEYVEEVVPQVNSYGDYNSLSYLAASEAAAVAKSVPISPGKQDVSVTVKVRWSLAGN